MILPTSNSSVKDLPVSVTFLIEAAKNTNLFLRILPSKFGVDGLVFFEILNQRNLSGFIGEVFKEALADLVSDVVPNPHPDGRPDLLDLSDEAAKQFFNLSCFDSLGGAVRSNLAPFPFGGIEVKCTIGNITGASEYPIGKSRVEAISGLTYWAHHRHACDLLGLYYDFCAGTEGIPQIKAGFYSTLIEEDWNIVSTGRSDRKKTSNTSVNRKGKEKIYSSAVFSSDEDLYNKAFERLGIIL